MTFPSSRLPSLRVWSGRGRIVCRVSWPGRAAPSPAPARDLALVASRAAPYLRRLTVYRPLPVHPASPDDPPRAA